jgi:hypothetical protein
VALHESASVAPERLGSHFHISPSVFDGNLRCDREADLQSLFAGVTSTDWSWANSNPSMALLNIGEIAKGARYFLAPSVYGHPVPDFLNIQLARDGPVSACSAARSNAAVRIGRGLSFHPSPL